MVANRRPAVEVEPYLSCDAARTEQVIDVGSA